MRRGLQLCGSQGARQAAPAAAPTETRKWIRKQKKPKVTLEVIDPSTLKPFAEDDVWISTYYHPKKYSLEVALQMHREFCQAAVLNNPNGILKLTMLLDCHTKKKTKFLGVVKNTVLLPNNFEDGSQNQVIVFAKDPEDQQVAHDLGAPFVGGLDLVKMIEQGKVRHDDFDHVVSHVDMYSELTPVRRFLRDQFPHKSKGNLGTNVGEMVTFFSQGKTYESEKLEEALGRLTVNLGTLNMSDQQLKDNLNAYIAAISSHRPASLGPFITSATLTCPPSPEKFLLSEDLFQV